MAVSLSLATAEGSVPLAYRLYLPREWAEDKRRCKHAGVPKEIGFATKGELAWAQIEAALETGIPRGPVLADAAYGDEAALRDRLSAHNLPYAVGIRPGTAVWWDEHQPAPAPVKQGRGRRRTRVLRDEDHQPIRVRELAQALPATVKMRWRIERDYRELKQEVGLGHYEGRNWRGFHHHASLCIAAYGFLMLEQLCGSKKNAARLKAPPLPEGFRPRGARS